MYSNKFIIKGLIEVAQIYHLDKYFVCMSGVRHIVEWVRDLSLSTIVLNSRDWSEIIWLPKNSHFKINLPIGLYPKKLTGMHWLGRNDAVP